MRRTLQERFWDKVAPAAPDECWLWTAYIAKDGYGKFNLARRCIYAHRFAYEDLIGEIPEGLVIDHLCRVRHCVNPWHLEPVSQQVNIRRGTAPSAVRAAQTHCKNGHELSGHNVKYTKRGGGVMRQCRTCINAWERAARAKRKVA